MYIYGIKPEGVYTNQDIDFVIGSMLKTFEIFGPREFVVIDNNTKKVTNCLTWSGLLKAYSKGKFYVSQTELYMKKIQAVYPSSLTEKVILNVAGKNRSLFMMKEGSNPKKLSFVNLEAQITTKNIAEMCTKKEYPEENCPYPYRFEVKR
jgi:hypothetical protein